MHCAPGARRKRNGDRGEGHRVLLVGLGRPLRLIRVDVHAPGQRTEVSVTATFSARLYLATFGPGSIALEKYPNGTLWRRACSGWTGSDYCGEFAYGEKILLSCSPVRGQQRAHDRLGGNVQQCACHLELHRHDDCDQGRFGDLREPKCNAAPIRLSAGRVVRPRHPQIAVLRSDLWRGNCRRTEDRQHQREELRGRRRSRSPVLQLRRPEGPRLNRTEGVPRSRREIPRLEWAVRGNRNLQFKARSTPVTIYAKFG